MTKRHKYRAQRTTVDGITFDSKKEARRWQELRLLEKAGEIRQLERQVRFHLWAYCSGAPKDIKIRSQGYPNGRAATWVADFVYHENGAQVIEDVKGMDTQVSRLKRAIVEAMLGTEIRIT